jgi:hypothetical protein
MLTNDGIAYHCGAPLRRFTRFVSDLDTAFKPTYENPLAELLGHILTSLNSMAHDAQNSFYIIVIIGVIGE